MREIPPCIYCNRAESDSPDHVPPRSLFPPPRPSNLITVPCCRACNESFAKDDEYFRMAMVLRADISSQPESSSLVDAIFRGWTRPHAGRFGLGFWNTVGMAEVNTPAGVFLGHTQAFEVSNRRLARVYARIVRGLFFHERGFRIPDDYGIALWLWLEEKPEEMKRLPRYFAGRPIRKLGKARAPVLVYSWAGADDQPVVSLWLMQFYRRAVTVAEVLPRADLKRLARSARRGGPIVL